MLQVRLFGAWVVFLLGACSSTPQSLRLYELPPDDIAQVVELSEVPFFPQQSYQCGPAALATLLNAQQLEVSAEELMPQVYIPKLKGSLQIEMIATARAYGLLSYPLQHRLDDILREVNAGHPVLVLQNLFFDFYPAWHYAVIIGYDLNEKKLLLRSGEIKRHQISFATFERTWKRASYWAYVLLKPGEIPVTANPLEYLKVSQELSVSSSPQVALPAFRQATVIWQEHPLTWMALGNAAFEAEDYEAAEQAFTKAIEQNPENALAWNNLAYVFKSKHCLMQAQQAIECAVHLKPEDQNILQSKKEISAGLPEKPGQCHDLKCPIDTDGF